LGLRDDKLFQCWRGGDESTNDPGTKIAGPSSVSVSSNAYHYFQFKTLLHASAGTIELKIDGVSVLTFAGNTIGSTSGLATVTQFRVGSMAAPGAVEGCWQLFMEQLVHRDRSGTYHRDFL